MQKSNRARPERLSLQEVKNHVRDAILLAGACMFAVYPMFLYEYRYLTGLILNPVPAPEQLDRFALLQAVVVFLLTFLCALVGFLYSTRLGLPRFGSARDIRVWLPRGLIIGLLLTPLAYLLADRAIYAELPVLYPNPWYWALAELLGGALAQEVLARFGLLTIGVYFLDRWGRRGYPWPVIVLISAFGVWGTYLFLNKFGLIAVLGPWQTWQAMGLAFALQWAYCALYLRYGFLPTLCIHLGLNVKFLVYAVLLT